MGILVRASIALLFVLLAACGGGGGGGGGPSNPAGGGSARGEFTLAQSTATFALVQNETATQRLRMTITGSDVAYVGAAYTNGQTQPSWLNINMEGAGTSYDVVLTVSAFFAPGTYSSTFQVGTADSAGNVLRSRPITVTLTVEPRIAVSDPALSYTFTYGGAVSTQDVTYRVTAPAKQWRASSNAPWLHVSSDPRSGDGTLTAAIDVDSLAPGTYSGRVTITNDAIASDSIASVVSVTVQAPTFLVDRDSILLGGEEGVSLEPQVLNLALDTDSVAHPFVVQVSTDSGGSWLQPSVTSGSLNGSGASVSINAVPASLAGGTYTGQLVVSVTVRDLVLTETLPVTFNLEANRLVVGTSGVMLSSSPSPARSVLTRSVTVHSSIDRANVPWSASSNQSWLTVTASGVTGEQIALSADPTGLSADTTHFATVTITSSDSTVENEQAIRVGLFINSAAPQDVSVFDDARFIAASPVEPIVFANAGGSSVIGYNVFTGGVDRTFSNAVANGGVMVVSEDGRRLFVYDTTNLRVTELNAATGAFVRHYADGSYPTGGRVGGLTFFRPDGYEVLVTPSSYMYELPSGTGYQVENYRAASFAASLTPSHDHRYLVPDFATVHRLKRSALNGGEMRATLSVSAGTAQGREGQACISADGMMLYTASGAPYNFPGTSMVTGQVTQVLPADAYPNSIQCLWNGAIVGGIDGYYRTYDVWIYDGTTGLQLANVSSSEGTGAYRSLLERGIAVSGDATRMITLSGAGPYSADLQMRLQSIPAP